MFKLCKPLCIMWASGVQKRPQDAVKMQLSAKKLCECNKTMFMSPDLIDQVFPVILISSDIC